MNEHRPGYLIRPDPADPRLTRRVAGVNEAGERVETSVTVERALTLYLNAQEIVTMMTIGDYPEDLARRLPAQPEHAEARRRGDGRRVRRGPLGRGGADRAHETNFEDKLKKRTQTSGCAQGTAFGDLMEALETVAPAGGAAAHLLALPADARHQHDALALSGSRRDPRLRARPRGPAARLHGGCRPPQRGRQDRRLDVPPPARAAATRSSTRPAASPRRW